MSDEVTEQVESVLRAEMTRTEALAAQGKCEVDVWIVVNESGDSQVGADEDQAADDFADNCGGDRRRTFRLRLVLPLPVVTGATGEVPDVESNDFNVEVRPS